MDCNALDIMALQIERYSFSKPKGAPHISILPSRRFAGTHEVSAAKHNGSIGVWIMVYSPPKKVTSRATITSTPPVLSFKMIRSLIPISSFQTNKHSENA